MEVRKTGNARKVWDLTKSFAGTIEKTGGLTYDKKKSSEKRMGAETVLKRGPLNVLACYVLWGILPLFWPCLGELSPLCVLGYRILSAWWRWGAICCWTGGGRRSGRCCEIAGRRGAWRSRGC